VGSAWQRCHNTLQETWLRRSKSHGRGEHETRLTRVQGEKTARGVAKPRRRNVGGCGNPPARWTPESDLCRRDVKSMRGAVLLRHAARTNSSKTLEEGQTNGSWSRQPFGEVGSPPNAEHHKAEETANSKVGPLTNDCGTFRRYQLRIPG